MSFYDDWQDTQVNAIRGVMEELPDRGGGSRTTILDQVQGGDSISAFLRDRCSKMAEVHAREGAFPHMPDRYKEGKTSNHRRGCGATWKHTLNTGSTVQVFLKGLDSDAPGVDLLSYLGSTNHEAEAHNISDKGSVIRDILNAGVESESLAFISFFADTYEGSPWGELLGNSSMELYPYHANTLELALIFKARGETALEEYVDEGPDRSHWSRLIQLSPEDFLEPPEDLFDENDAVDLEQVLKDADITPGDYTYTPPALGARDLFTHCRERLAWLCLIGDSLLVDLAVKRLQAFDETNQEAQKLGHFFFSVHQAFTGPVFYGRGGPTQVSRMDLQTWVESLESARWSEKLREWASRLLLALWRRGQMIAALLDRGIKPEDAGEEVDPDVLADLKAIQAAPGHVPLKEAPDFLKSLAGRSTPALGGGSPEDRIESLREVQAEVRTHVEASLAERLAKPMREAAARTGVSYLAAGAPLLLPDPASKVWAVADLLFQTKETKRTLEQAREEMKDLQGEITGHTLIGHEGFNPDFLVWDDANPRVADPAFTTDDGSMFG